MGDKMGDKLGGQTQEGGHSIRDKLDDKMHVWSKTHIEAFLFAQNQMERRPNRGFENLACLPLAIVGVGIAGCK